MIRLRNKNKEIIRAIEVLNNVYGNIKSDSFVNEDTTYMKNYIRTVIKGLIRKLDY